MEQELFPLLNFIKGKILPYGRKVIIIHYHYRLDPKLGPGSFGIRRFPCSCHACTTILSLSWYSKIKEAVNQPRYGQVHNCKYSQILGCHDNCILNISR